MNLKDKPSLPCFLCGKTLRIKISKSDKPYFICNPCGLQAFVRYGPGVRRLKQLLYDLEESGGKFLSLNDSSFKTLSLISRLSDLNAKLEDVKQNKSLSDYFLTGTDSEMAEKALEKEIRAVKKAIGGRSEK